MNKFYYIRHIWGIKPIFCHITVHIYPGFQIKDKCLVAKVTKSDKCGKNKMILLHIATFSSAY